MAPSRVANLGCHHRVEGPGLALARIAVELNKRKVATPRGGKSGSLVGGECAATSRSLKRIVKSQNIGFQAGMIRR